ncbi:uncharacterized protein LOC119310975 isoform X2 [Triticum dicoccoides]|nr:uncharacterized protein LOC119310975 isoform X2 [Triticum dicoccoides]
MMLNLSIYPNKVKVLKSYMEVVISSPLWLSLVFPGSEHLHDGTQQSRSQGDKSRDGLISISHVKMIGKSTGVILLHGIRHQVKQRGFYGCSRDQCLEEIDRTDEVSIYEIKPVTIHLIPWVHMMRRIFAYQGKHHIRGHFSQFHRGRKLLCLHHVRRVLLDVDFIYFICKALLQGPQLPPFLSKTYDLEGEPQLDGVISWGPSLCGILPPSTGTCSRTTSSTRTSPASSASSTPT